MGRKRKSLDLAELKIAKIKHRDEMRKSRGTCENVDVFGIIERQEEFVKKQNERTVVRLEKAKVRTTSARATESSPARRARLQKKKDRSASARATESSPARRARLQKKKDRSASARATESSPARRARLQKKKDRSASARATESSPARRARLQEKKDRSASARATESSPGHRARLQKDKSRAASARAAESSPARRARLQEKKDRAASARATESSPARRARLQEKKDRSASARATESSPARRARLQEKKDRSASARATESSPAHRARLQKDMSRAASARAAESSPARRARLQEKKDRAVSARAAESSPARRARLQEKKDRAVSARAAESSPAHRVRLQRMKKSAIVSRRSLNVTAGLQELTKGVFSGLASPAQFLNAGRSDESATIARRSSKRTTSFEGSANANQNIDINPPPAKLRKVTATTADHAKKRRKSKRVSRGGVKKVAAPRADTGSGSVVIDDHAGVVADIPVDAVEDHWDDDFDLPTAEFDPADAAVSFCTQMFQLKSHFCPNCRERFPDIKIDSKTLICQKCKRHGKHKFSVGNNMIPGDVPQELENLTIMEQLLISPRLPTFSVYRRPMGQYSYSGNVITFPQDVETLVDVLPRVSSDLHMLVLRKQGKGGTFKDERVRRNVVEKALNWLCEHNTWFKDNIRLDRARIDSLPEDGTIDLAEIDEPVVDEEAENSDCEGDMPISQDESSLNDEPNLELIAEPEVPDGSDGNNFVTAESTFVPGASIQLRLESEMKQETVGAMLYGADAEPIPWPALDVSNPVNEFDTVGFLTTSFPHLFPYGRADLHESARNGATVSELEYFRHLIRFDDGRFSKDPRFRYVALNIILRHRAMASGRVFVKNNSDLSKLTIEDLKSMGRADKSELMKSISRYGQSLSGTKQYWGARRQELLAMIRQKGQLPTFFFTLSAADLQWPDLHRLMPGYTSKTTAVIENPLLCCWFFIERVKVLLNTVFKHDLQCEDYWGRFEFQARGSIHFHGLAWMRDAPDVTKIDTETDQEILRNYVEYFDQFVSAVNPAFDESGVGVAPNIRINPASIPYLKVQPTIDKQKLDRIGLVVYCHTHACRLGYCQRVVNGEKTCRFKFPFELQQESKINVSVDEKTGAKTVDFLINRNDPIMCPLNWRVAQVHRANTNFQPIVCKRHLIGYCTKYVCKSEIQSQMMKLLTEAALTVTNPTDPVRQIAQKTLNLIVGGRDYTAQETMLVLMGMPQYLSSRSFVPLFLSGKSELTVEDGVPVIVSSAVEKYANLRPTGLEEISLTDFYIHHFFRQDGTVGVHRNDKSAIVVPKAVRRVGVDSPLYEEYARDTLMLKKPFRSIKNDLLGPYESFAESLAAFEGQSLPDEFDLNEDVQERENAPTEQVEEPEVERVNSHSCRVPAEFAHLMQSDVAFEMGVNQATDCDWSESYRRNEEYQQVRGFFEKVADFNDVNNGDVDDSHMNEKQREVYSEVESHMLTTATNKAPLLKIVTGTAGTGKSYLISCLKKLLGKKLLIIAPTGVAAWNVRGRTINAALRIPVVSTKNFTELQGPALEELQDGLKEVEYIIVEEMSMVGLSKLAMIDSRLRQAFPPCSGQAFGGRSVVLVGDFGQLPPPGDSRMFVRKPRNQFQMAGAFAYRSFKSCTVLDTVVRQEGDAIFRGMLQRLRVGRFTKDDYGILKQRFAGTVRSTDFQNATHLFTKRVDVNQHNICKLGVLKEPIALINSVNTGGAVAEKATSDDAGGLDTFQMLAKGAKIMLTSNVNIDMGLCNGCVGTVIDIVYRDNEGPPGLPLFVLCDFPSYTGPAFVASRPTLFPVAPVTRRFSKSGVSAARTMIPLCLAWAITVHKSQGLTLDRMVLDLGRTEFATGLAFVALSRVRRLEDVMLRPFRFERLANIGGTAKSAVSMQLLRAEDDRLKRMSGMMLESESELSYGSRPVSALSQVRSLLSSLENTPEVRVGTSVQGSVHAEEPTAANEQIPFRPLTALDRERMCQRLRINYHAESRGPVYGADKDISVFLAPTDSGLENVFGDGNCFYYALCLAVSNSRNDQTFNQRVFRNCMAAYIKNHGGEFGWDDGFLNETLEDTEKNYAYAGEGHFVVAAGVLGCSIYIYGNYSSDGFSWKGYHPTQERKTTDRSVYLFHCTLDQRPSADANHFVLVTSV